MSTPFGLSRAACEHILTAGASGYILRADLRRDTHGHNAAVCDADGFSDVKAAGIVRVDQYLLLGAAVANQQIIAADLKDTGLH